MIAKAVQFSSSIDALGAFPRVVSPVASARGVVGILRAMPGILARYRTLGFQAASSCL
jgi:hypothetical protein